MFICKNCGQAYSEPVRFCGKCGGDAFEAQYAQPEPAYGNPASSFSPYSYPTAPAAGGSKVPSILGMVFGIVALFFEFYQMIYCIGMSASRYYRDEAFVFFWVFSMFVLPLAIVGLVMSFKGGSQLRGMSIAGKITSFITLGMWMLTFLICLGNM